jgi:hypothetical protein
MSDSDAERKETLEKLARSRAEILQILEPPRIEPGSGVDTGYADKFPRSRTMRVLLSGRGLGTVGTLIGGLVLARPALLLRIARMVPAGAVARMLLAKGIATLRSNAAARRRA